jgi:tetratricopeptide (TPR) repeat protein
MKRIFIVIAIICGLNLLFVIGCAHKPNQTVSSLKPVPLSPQAKASYNFLKYLDLKRQNRVQEALEYLQKTIDQDPSPDLYMEKALMFWNNEDIDQAQSSLEKGIESFPRDQRLTLTLARLFVHQDEFDKALELLQRYTEEYPDHGEILLFLAKLYLKDHQHSQAIDVFQTLSPKQRNAEIEYLMGQAYSKLKDHARAIKHFQQAIDKDPSMTKAWIELAYEHERIKNYVQATEIYKALFKKDSENTDILLRLIELHIKLNDPGKALYFVQQGPQISSFLLRATALFLEQGLYNDANFILHLIHESRADHPRALFFKAILALKYENQPAQAINLLKQIPEETYLYPRALSLMAQIFLQQENTDQALQMTQKGRQLFPENEDFWILESEVLSQQHQYNQAIEVLKKGLDFLPDNANLLFQLGITAHNMDNSQLALETMEHLISLNPDHAQALNFLGYTLTVLGRDYVRAHVLLKKALSLDPQNGYFLDSLAWLYFKQEKFNKAWEIINQAVAQVTDDPVIWEHFGDIAHSLKKDTKARKAYQKAIELGSTSSNQLREKINNL